MWRAITKALEIVPQLIGQLPAGVRQAAIAALIICGLLALITPVVMPLLGQLPADHWVTYAILGSLTALVVMIAFLAFLVVLGVAWRFFRGL